VNDSCLFCEIAGGRIAAARVYEDEDFVAFLDHRPLFAGHTLVVPRVHYGTLMDLPPVGTGPLFELVRRMCTAVEKAAAAEGTFVAVNNRVSQSVPHLHVHVVPRRPKDGLKGFFWPRTKYRDEGEMESMRAAIAEALG